MNGLQTLKRDSQSHAIPVIMFSSVLERRCRTLKALHYASDYVPPASAAGSSCATNPRDLLVPGFDRCAGSSAVPACNRPDGGVRTAPTPFTVRPLGPMIKPDIIAICMSTGGPAAVGEILSQLTADFPAPIVLVPHMPQVFTRFFADRLSTQTALAVTEAVDGGLLKPGVVHVAPGDFHLTVQRRDGVLVTVLDQNPPENSHRPAADVLFRSVAETFGARALALVLTGMGQDGLRGTEAITRAGGRVVVQDEASSVVWEMAGLVASGGLADAVLPLGAIAGELRRRVA